MDEYEVNPNENPPVKRKRGRPKGSGKNQKVVTPDFRAPMREAMREDENFVYSPEDDDDRLKIDKRHIPEGMEYLWVTASVLGQPQPQRLARFQKQGWKPVDSSRHDGMFMPKGHKGQIEVDGLVLHERPKKISDLARAYERKKAQMQVRTKEQQLLGGGVNTTSGMDPQHPSALRSNRITKDWEPIEIPED